MASNDTANRRDTGSARPTPRLYVVTPPVEDADALAQAFPMVLAVADVAAVLLRLADADERSLIRRIKAVAAVVQGAGAALILEGRPDLVGRAGADGAHLSGIAAFQEALETLKPQRIAGAGGLTTRHDAMLAAESGADYVMFGEPDRHGQRPRFEAVIERVDWWATVFEAPCVGYAEALDEVSPLAAAGADFVAIGDWMWSHADGPSAAMSEAQARLVAGAPA